MSFDGSRGPPNIEGMTSLKVDNLTYRTTIEDLKRVFQKHGDVGDVYIPRDPRNHESRGFAFVRFFEKRDAEDAMDSVDGMVLDGREIRVQNAKYGRPASDYRPRAPRGGRHGGGGGGGGGYGGGGSRSRRSYSPRRRRSRSRSYSPRKRSRSHSPRRQKKMRSTSRSPRRRPQSKSPRQVRRQSASKSPKRQRSRSSSPKQGSRSPAHSASPPPRNRSKSPSPDADNE